jgi:putative membrane protein
MRDRPHMPPGQFRRPDGRWFEEPRPRGFGGFGLAHALFPWLFLLLFAVLVAVAIMAFVRFTKQTPRGGAGVVPPPAGGISASDQALQSLGLRYARGEIDRDEYLQKSADLGDTRPMPPPATG